MYALQTIIKLLRLIVSGSKLGSTPSDTDDNNQVAGLTDVYSVLDTKLEDIKTKLDNLRVDVKADDIDIGEINVDTTEIISKLNDISSVLINRLFTRLADKVTVVNHGTSDTTFALTPNVYHIWGTVSALTLTLATPSDVTALNEYMFQFTCGSTVTTLSLPSNVSWIGGTPLLEANTTYQVSIIDNIAVIGGA